MIQCLSGPIATSNGMMSVGRVDIFPNSGAVSIHARTSVELSPEGSKLWPRTAFMSELGEYTGVGVEHLPREVSRILQCWGGSVDFTLSNEKLLKGLSQEEEGEDLIEKIRNEKMLVRPVIHLKESILHESHQHLQL